MIFINKMKIDLSYVLMEDDEMWGLFLFCGAQRQAQKKEP